MFSLRAGMVAALIVAVAATARAHHPPTTFDGSGRLAAAPDAPSQPRPCPRGERAGQVLWSVYQRIGFGFVHLAIGDDGTVYATTGASTLKATDCHGEQLWAVQWPSLGQPSRQFPVVDDAGQIYLAIDELDDNGATYLLAFGPTGERLWAYRAAPMPMDDNVLLPAIDASGRIYFGTFDGITNAIHVLNGFGFPLRGYPVDVFGVNMPSIALADDRVVFVGSPGDRLVWPRLTPTPSPTTTHIPTGNVTPTPSATPIGLLHLPLIVDEMSQVGPDESPTALPGIPPVVETIPARLHFLSTGQVTGRTVDIGDLPVRPLAVAGGMLIVEEESNSPPTLKGFAFDADPPREVWAYRLSAAIVGSPLVGRRDAATGRYEVIFLDFRGMLVSMQVPGAPDFAGVPTFNWAQSLQARSFSAPVLGDGGMVYVGIGSTVAAIRRSDGEPAWSVPLSAFALFTLLAPGGVLYVADGDHLTAIATESRGLDPEAAWPMFRGDARNSGQARW